ncbi:MAG: helix-turn-helix transcriptional regulator [Eubacteriales bacterium]
MKFGDILSELRKDKGLLQKHLAEILNVSVSTISNYETNAHFPDIHTLIQLSDFFEVSIDYLLGRSGINSFPKDKQTEKEAEITYLLQKVLSYDSKNMDSILDYLELLDLRK